MRNSLLALLFAGLFVAAGLGNLLAQETTANQTELTGQVVLSKNNLRHGPAIVVWLKPADHAIEMQSVHPGRFTLLQKNRMFSPHLLVIPVGSAVNFPNADPFFHNVFSLFNGKRFDLGLYEAGSSREVVFSREGVSYIFCNIHPEMSAVVLALSTPWFASADASGRFAFHQIPPGDYDVHVWIEGTLQPSLERLTKTAHIHAGGNSILIDASNAPRSPDEHLNKFGKPYEADVKPAY